MIDHTRVTEDELHAFVDDELPAHRRTAVEAWLATHAEDAARVAAWKAQAEALRARYGGIVEHDVPPRLAIDGIVRRRRAWPWVAAAAAIVAFIAGGAVGWVVRGASISSPGRIELFTSDALNAHKLYVAEVRHPIEVPANAAHLVPWLSRRVGTSLRTPDLNSF